MLRALLGCAVLLGMTASVSAADAGTDPGAQLIAPFVDDQTILVARLDLTKIDLEGFLNDKEAVIGSLGRSVHRLKGYFTGIQKQIVEQGGTEIYLIYGPPSDTLDSILFVVPVTEDTRKAQLAKVLRGVLGEQSGAAQVGKTLIAGHQTLITRISTKKFTPSSRPEFAAALAAETNASAQVVLAASGDQRRVLAAMVPDLPKDLGGASGKQLINGINFLSLALELKPKGQGQFMVQTNSDDDALMVCGILNKALKATAGLPHLPSPLQQALASGGLAAHAGAKRVSVVMGEKEQGARALTALLTALANDWWENLCHMHMRQNIRQVALAMHNFLSANNDRFPAPVSVAKDGKPGVSWRVRILPYVDANALYQKYKQDEPWDSANNLALLKEIPGVYTALDQDPASGLTQIQMPTNAGTIGGDPKGCGFKDVTDGSSNTILVLQVAPESAVPWTKPADFQVDWNNPWKGVVERDDEKVWSAFVDGSSRALIKKKDGDNLLKFLTISGGEPIQY